MQSFGGVQALTGVATLWALVFADAGWGWWALALFGCFLYGCVGLSVEFDRYFPSRSLEAPCVAVVVFHMFGVMACIGAAAGRSVTHHRHRMHADRTGGSHPAKALGWRALPVGSYEGRRDGGPSSGSCAGIDSASGLAGAAHYRRHAGVRYLRCLSWAGDISLGRSQHLLSAKRNETTTTALEWRNQCFAIIRSARLMLPALRFIVATSAREEA